MVCDKVKSNVQSPTSKVVALALKEDVGTGDITTNHLIPSHLKAKAIIRAKEAGVIAGLMVAKEVFKKVDRLIGFRAKVKDGALVKKGTIIAEVFGPARGILTGERTALNFLQHLSGIATLTRKFSLLITRYPLQTKILDTRKTTPGLRALEKYAVKVGGGKNHRLGLYDAMLIKDNHVKLLGGIKRALVKSKVQGPKSKVEIEARTLGEVKLAIEARADRILLDNMNLKALRQAVKLCKKAGTKTEASGGVNLQNVRAIAKTGVDYISVGALTHSAKALDISLKVL